MDLTINISSDYDKKEPICAPVSFSVTHTMREQIAKVRAEKKKDINTAVRSFLEKYLEHITKQDQ